MTEAQNKAPTQGTPEQQAQQPQGQPVYALQPPGAAQYATVGAYPPYYPYPPPPTDANGHPTDPNVAGPGPPGTYMMAFPPPPPGMIYAYTSSQGYPGLPFAPGMPLPAALVRPKRKQVKMACTNCAAACKRCDEGRPCERCCKYGISDTCQDGVRKERKKGIKRGPYKRKGKVSPDQSYEGFPQEQPPTGFYPQYFYPPAGFVPLGPDGQPLQGDAAAAAVAGAQQGMAHPQYYPLHPAAYPPFTTYPHPAGSYPAVMPAHMLTQPVPAGAIPGASEEASESDPASPVANGNHPESSKSGGAKDDSAPEGGGPGRNRKRGKAASNNANGEQVSSKKVSKKAAAPESEDGGDGSLIDMAGAQGTSM